MLPGHEHKSGAELAGQDCESAQHGTIRMTSMMHDMEEGTVMKAKQVTGAVFNMIFRLVLSIIIILVVYRLAMYSYHLGYMVFADVAKEAEPGRDITIAVDTEDSTMDVAKTLENRGLIDDARVFFLQEMLSEYRGKIQPGVYTLNTSMTAEKMLAEMAANAPSDDEESEDAQTTDTENTNASDDVSDGVSDAAEDTPAATDTQSAESDSEDVQ